MIVKNEEAVLEKCLESIKDVADEIIITDTGLTDKTIDIAKKFTDKIYHFKWVNDFAAANDFSRSYRNNADCYRGNPNADVVSV